MDTPPLDSRSNKDASLEDEEEGSLLKSEDYFLHPASRAKSNAAISGCVPRWSTYILSVLLFLNLGVMTIIWSLIRPAECFFPEPFYSPANDAIKWVDAPIMIPWGEESIYAGPPNDNNKAAWRQLMAPGLHRMTPDELAQTNEELPDSARLVGGDYVTTLGAFHDLHCLKNLREFLYSGSIAGDRKQVKHLDHCLEMMRQSVMCHGETTVYTYHFEDYNASHPIIGAKTKSRQHCVKWDSFYSWADDRKIERSTAELDIPHGHENDPPEKSIFAPDAPEDDRRL